MFYRNEITGDDTPERTRYPWWEMEEYRHDGGMWKTPPTLMRGEYIRATSELMANPPRFLAAMLHVLDVWPRSARVAFTTPGLNQRAWIGHAGCYLATGSPEETTRLGWHQLDDGEQYGANAMADQAIMEWRRRQADADRADDQLGLWDAEEGAGHA